MNSYRQIGEFFRTESPRLVRFLRRYASSVSSEDIAQESFARLCAIAPDAIAEPRAYLYETARNLAMNAVRRQKGAPVRSVADIDAVGAVSPNPSPEDDVGAAQDRALMNAALAQLPDHQRVSLLLFRIEGWSHREIGAHLGVSHRTVERYIADALTRCHLAVSRR